MRKAPITRRTMLRGVGASMALPWLEAMAPAASTKPPQPPVRLAVLYMPNGAYMSNWNPKEQGRQYKLSPILEPIAPVRDDVLVLTGFRNTAGIGGDGHYAKTTSWLTGATAVRTGGKDIRAGVSFDQLAAAHVGKETALPSMELGVDPVHTVVDMGYSTIYGCHISWRTPTQPAAKEINVKSAFDRLFRSSDLGRNADDASVLDLVMQDARKLRKQIGGGDRQKLDEYLDSVRELEARIERIAAIRNKRAGAEPAKVKTPNLVDNMDYPTHVRLMLDVIATAFWTDSTRVSSFMFGNDVSGRGFPFVDGVREGFHPVSHHEYQAEKQKQYAKINRWHVEQVVYLIQKLKSYKEGDRTLLDNSMVLFGSSISDGQLHSPLDVPTLLAGGGGGRIDSGRCIKVSRMTPLCDLFVTMLGAMGVPTAKFGDSVGDMDKQILRTA